MVALDGKGNPVTDLKQADLALTDRGQPREIAFFRFDGAGAPADPAAASVSTAARIRQQSPRISAGAAAKRHGHRAGSRQHRSARSESCARTTIAPFEGFTGEHARWSLSLQRHRAGQDDRAVYESDRSDALANRRVEHLVAARARHTGAPGAADRRRRVRCRRRRRAGAGRKRVGDGGRTRQLDHGRGDGRVRGVEFARALRCESDDPSLASRHHAGESRGAWESPLRDPRTQERGLDLKRHADSAQSSQGELRAADPARGATAREPGNRDLSRRCQRKLPAHGYQQQRGAIWSQRRTSGCLLDVERRRGRYRRPCDQIRRRSLERRDERCHGCARNIHHRVLHAGRTGRSMAPDTGHDRPAGSDASPSAGLSLVGAYAAADAYSGGLDAACKRAARVERAFASTAVPRWRRNR